MTVEEWKRKNPPIQRKPLTNGDSIRGMSDEELGEFLITTSQTDGFCPREQTQCAKHKYSCVTCVIAWLKEEAESEGEDGRT